MKNFNLIKRLWTDSHEKQSPQRFGRYAAMLIMLLTLGVGQMWAKGYNGESHVYLNVDGTTKYYKVSTESWSTGASLPGTWGGELKNQTFNNIHTLELKGGAIGGWTNSGESLSGTLYYKITANSTTPSSGWTSVGGINSSSAYSGSNCFYYKNNYSTNVTPHEAGTYYLHIKITDGDSNNRTSYVKFTIPSYTVAGSSAVLGTDWSETDTNNDMVWSSGTTYTLTKSNVTLSTGTTYECKVVLNHNWSEGSYPGSNKTFTVTANGHYNVTFSFNASTKAVDVSTTRLYAVIYNDNGKTSGSVPTTSYHANGATVTVASNSGSLAKTGYTFEGWNTNSSGTGTNYTAGSGTFTMGSSDKNLFAKWTENMSTVSFVASPTGKGTFTVGGSTVTSTTAGVTTTREVTAVPISGYKFTGWSISGGASISSTSDNPTTVTGGGAGTAATLTATFEKDLTSYTLTFGAGNSPYNNGSVSAVNTSTSATISSGSTVLSNTDVEFTATPNTHYKLTGWYSDAACSSAIAGAGTTNPYTKTITADQGVYAKFEIKQCTITLDKNGGSTGAGSVTASHGSTLPLFTAHTRDGYTLQGYFTESSGGTKIINANGSLVASTTYADASSKWNNDATSLTLYAQWTENLTTVNLVASPTGKGTFTSGGGAVTYVSAGVATNPEVTAVPATGYRLTGTIWSESSDYISLSSTTTAATTITATGATDKTANLTATFTPKTSTITLNNQDATTPGSTSVTATYDAAMPAITLPEKTGYTFGGFWGAPGGSGPQYYNADGSSTKNWNNTESTYTLYAKWTANNYTVTLSQSGETGYGSAGTGSVSATYDAAMPTIASLPTPAPGYKFEGYWSGVGGTGTQYYAANGSSVTNWNVASATTLHAYFKKTEISSLEHPASIANGDEITLDVNPIFNQTGATGNLAICWSLTYDNDNPVESGVAVASYTESGSKPDQVRFTLTGLSAGYYKVKAVLKAKASAISDACNGSEVGVTELMTITSNVRIAGNSKVTIQYKDNSGNTLAASQTIEIASGESEGVKAPSMIGYTFTSWTLDPVLTNTCENSTSCGTDKDTINISAAYDGFLTANYTKKDMIYFNNTVGWEHVYVYFYDNGDYWDHETNKGIGAQYNYAINDHSPHYYHFWGEMTRIGTSNVYYFDYQAAAATINPSNAYKINSYTHVAFTKDAQGYTDASHIGYAYFYSTEAAYRTDFAHDKSMYVPLNANTVNKNVNGSNKTVYYNTGYWMNYPENTGYTLKIYDNKTNGAEKKSLAFTFSADMKMPMSITTDLEANKTYGFKIERVDGTAYGNASTMSNGHSGDEGQTVWEFKSDKGRCGLTTSSAGDYTFTLSYGEDASHNYNYLVGVHYPEATGDFRVLYKDNEHTTWRASSVIPKNLDHDTISYFVRKAQSPVMKLQKCTATYSAGKTTVTWTDTVANLIPTLPDAITEDGVYYFCINKNAETGKRELGDTKPYEGNFYIRVDGAGYSNWDNFRASDHLMPYSDYSFKQTTNPYSHYFCKWYDCSGGNKNIKFVVANDYSVCISDTLARETTTGQWANIGDYIDDIGNLNRSANVRFMYNYKTNEVSRAFIDGAYEDGGNFLKILARTADGIYAAAEGGVPLTEITFTDNGNWIYEKIVYAVPGAKYKLRSLFGTTDNSKHVITQFFKGGAGSTAADSATMIGGTGSSRMQIRLLYDFKTNRVVTAYQPSGTIDENLSIHADIMFMREHQGDVEQITFASGKSITDIENIYCGLRFNKWTLNNRKKDGDNGYLDEMLSRYERDLFYVSFPYDVKLSDVIGFGTYGTHWIVEYYDGAARAKDGFWVDSESYWKFVTPAMKDTFTLKAGTGYIVALDLDELYCFKSGGIITQASVWANTAEVELLFPGKVSSISDRAVTFKMPEHKCTINRGTSAGNRTIKDSHWNVLGVPTFKNITGAASVDGGGSGALRFANVALINTLVNDMKFIYDGNLADNSLTAKAVKGFEFKAMHAYVVQYCGDVTFTTSASPAPASIVARRTYAEKPVDIDFRLELAKDGVIEDQAFISLSNSEDASADFVFGEDLSKEFNNNRANVYTFIGTEWAAGNTLPMSDQKTIVPVGVKIAAEGEYTFSIPEGTYGVGITLIDNETGARTNLSLMDYTVNLSADQIDNRFLLEISPIKNTPTGIDNIDEGQNSNVRKVMVDGLLYIVKDGKVFDAQGRQVK